MGNIRGTHSSPGVYTKMTDKKQIRTRISLITNKNEDVSNISIGGGSSSKTNVTINGNVVEENGLYYVVLNAKPAVLDDITISMDINDEPKQVTMKKGSVEEKIETDDKYCKIENVTVEPQSTSVAKYSVNKVVNPNGDGKFKVKIIEIKDNVQTNITSEEHKFNTTVELNKKDVLGYNFIKWELEGQEYTNDTISFIMPENDVEVRCYYNIKTFTITWKNDDDDNTVLTSTTVNYGVKPEYPNENPSKVSTEKYNYTFKGWTPSITEAKEDKTYTAEYLSEIRKYEIIFVNEDGTELLRTDVEYDTTPTYNGPVPTKEQTDEFTYTFIGWNPAITTVTGDTEYTAQYASQTREYNITFIVGNKEEIIPVPYGDTPKYPNGTPTIESTQQYDYTFDKWDPAITTVTGDTEYTAIFSSTLRSYTIKFLDSEGRVLQSGTTEYGTTPTYNGPVPTKEQTDEFTYTFIGWNPAITTVTGDTEYTAQFEQSTNTYTVTWKNYDGTTLETDEDVPYGETPEYNGATPTRESTVQYDFVFSRTWKPEITTVTGNATYTAKYTQQLRQYDITWLNDDNTELAVTRVPYGYLPEYNGATPTKEGNTQYSYKFNGWYPEITTVTGEVTYTAQFEEIPNTYTITWKNHDGTVLETDTDVPYGATPEYNGATPTKEGNAQYSYNFTEWVPEITKVTGDTEYTATFNEEVNKYTITWKNYNGEVLETDTGVTYDTIPTYDGPEPTREADEKYTYTFNGWTPTITAATSNATYTANFNKVEKPTTNSSVYYSMPFVNELENLDENKILEKFSSFEYNDSTLKYDIKPTIPFLDNDDVWNEFYDNGNDPSIWEEHGYVFCIAIPSSVLDTHEVVYTEDGQHPVTLFFNKELTINNTNYDVYVSSAGEPSDPYYGTDNPIVLNDAKIIFSKQ